MKKLSRMQSSLFTLLLLISVSFSTSAQIVIGQDTLVGNEWIDFDQSYFKMMVAEDGIYRVSYDELKDAGVPVENLTGAELQVFYFGEEQAISVSTDGPLTSDDYIEFVGVKNRGSLDQHLYRLEADQLNPLYSLYTDTSAYFLTWEQGASGNRYAQETVDLTGNTLSAEPYYMHEDVVIFNDIAFKPSEAQDVRFSQYLPGEGFCSNLNATNTVDHVVSNKFENGPAPSLGIRLSGNNLMHTVDISINDNIKLTANYGRQETKQFDIELQEEDFGNGNAQVKVRSYQSPSDKNSISNSVLRYAREFNFEDKAEFEFVLPASSERRYLEINRFSTSGNNVRVIDITNNLIYTPVIVDDIVKVILNSSTETATYKIYNSESIKSVSAITDSPMVDYSEMNDTEFIIYTSKQFDKAHNDGTNYLRAYADHRASQNGGSYSSSIVFVEDLYNQFAYGISRHPLSLKNHSRWVEQNWTNAKFNFLIGKGLEYASSRTPEQLSDPDPLKLKTILPTFGLPGSDNSLMAKKDESQPRIPTGRISASSIEDIKIYHDKIIVREDPNNYPSTIEGRLWTKKVIHLAGGDPNILDLIESSLDNMGNILVQNRFGAEIVTFSKQNSDNISSALSTQILNEVDEGAALLSFFGHSSAGTFDFSIEEASQYNNAGRLPVLLSMGCYSGNIYTPNKALSENFVLEPEVGSIAFMASSGSAYITPQGDLGERFYQALGVEQFRDASIGEIVHHLLEQNKNIDNSFVSLRTLNEQFTLHGDPAVKIITFDGPDYTIDYSSVNTNPSIVGPEDSEVRLNFNVINLGENTADSINVRMVQTLPNGTMDSLYQTIKGPGNRSAETFIVQNPGLNGIGENCISIDVNYDSEVVESPLPDAANNNTLGAVEGEEDFCFFVLDNSANPIFPEEFAIVNGEQPKLIASTSNILAEDRTYIMELDTTSLFNSASKETKIINEGGGSLVWEPEQQFEPGKVYYWRVSSDSTNVDIGYQWRESSFIYLPNSSDGWNQSHYYQFLRNDLTGIEFDDRKLDFINEAVGINTNLHIPQSEPNGDEIRWPRWNQQTFKIGFMRTWDYPGSSAVVVGYRDDRIAEFERNESPGLHGSWYSGGTSRLYIYPMDTKENRIDLVNMLEDVIEDGHHVLIHTIINDLTTADLHTEDWALDSLDNNGRNLFNVLEAQGATEVRKLEDLGTVFWGGVYTKGEEWKDENIGATILDEVALSAEFERNYIEGDFNTPNIGPAISWDKMIWNVDDIMTDDTYMAYIQGIKSTGEMDTLFTVIGENEVDLSGVDATEYPYIRLDMYTYDRVNRTPVNVNFWRVLYESAPEAILTKDESFVFNSDTLDQGQIMEFAIKAENISGKDMDSLLVKYTITNDANEAVTEYKRLAPLKSNDVQQLNFSYDTRTLSGDQQFNFEINPDGDQQEKFLFNNFGVTDFYVRQDEKDPVLDVSFDGVHIINGDIVSATPFILIDVRDDNEYLLLDDPEKILVAVIDPNGNRIDYDQSSPELTFEPATDTDNNQAKISLEPTLTVDGDYRLLVQAIDATGNFSGDNAYEVTFRVMLKESVSNVLNYPNPFSTQTQFIFTLTGSEVPDDISISILTVSGKVVKEISREELGPLRIGLNRTDYRWKGTDDYGEKLANGVYLYKVNLPRDMERYENQATDNFFTKGFGKLVIMR